MIRIRPSKERGFFDHGWLKTMHTFSFGDYHDPNHHEFRTLRVINEDFIASSQGFGTHAHRDMNIITYIIDGKLEHKDSMGNGSQISAGEWQFMSAGTGVEHSEFNPSSKPVHLLQIWIKPNVKNAKPRYDQLVKSDTSNSLWRTVASGTEKRGQIHLDQDAIVIHGKFNKDEEKKINLPKGKGVWIQLISGCLRIDSELIIEGDGVAIENQEAFSLKAEQENTEFIFFEL